MKNRAKRMDISEFVNLGYLQEVNRQFLHPLGLALEVTEENGTAALTGIWDCRDDPEGIVFEDLGDEDAKEHARYVDEKSRQRAYARIQKIGSVVQPIPIDPTGVTSHVGDRRTSH